MYRIEHYTRPNGEQRVRAWLNSRQVDQYTAIAAKIERLELEGPKLLDTEMMRTIKNSDLWELRGGQCRVLLYFEQQENTFVLLHGFLKKGRVEPREIAVGESLLQEYFATKQGGACG